MNAQSWENPGSVPDYPIAYDQNGAQRTVVTRKNIYRSEDSGSSWARQTSGTEYDFEHDLCRIYGDVLLLRGDLDPQNFSSTEWAIYSSTDGGATLNQVFVETSAFSNATYGYDHEVYQADVNTFVIRFQSNGIQPSGDDASIYVSTNQGQSWNLLFRHPENFISFAGTTATEYVFLFEDELIYRNKNTGALSNTVTLPEACQTASVNGGDIKLITWTENNGELRGYTSTNGGASFSSLSTSTSAPDFDNAQIFGDLIFASGGTFSLNSKTYRTSFSNFTNVVQLSAAGFYTDYFPYRITSDGEMANLLAGALPHAPNIFANAGGDFFKTPFYVSDDNWSTLTPASRPNYALEAMPNYQGNHLRFAGPYAWNTTDGVNFNQSFSMSNSPSEIFYFENAATANSYSDPSTTHYITNDALTVASNEVEPVGAGGNLYSARLAPFIPQGVWESTDGGESWNQVVTGSRYFWSNETYGDEVTGDLYGLKFSGPINANLSNFTLAKSTDNGDTWKIQQGTNFPTDITGDDYYHNRFKPIAFYNGYIFIKAESALKYSTDGGASFQTMSTPFLVEGGKMYLIGNYLCFQGADESFHRVNIDTWLGTGGGGTLPGGNIDLSLAVEMNPPEPPIWSNFDVTYTITNSGDITATGVGIDPFIASFNDAIQQGGTTPTPAGFGPNNSIPAGQSASITYHYFRKDGAMPQPWGEIVGHFEPDPDSWPNNGSWPDVNEDDEAIVGGGPVCAITTSISNIECNNNGTPSDPNDDLYSFFLVAINPVPGTYTLNIPELGQTFNGTYGSALFFENLLIADGDLSLNLTDDADPGCTASTTMTPPDPCSGSSGCTLTASVAAITCNDNTTPSDPTDDRFSVRFDVTADGASCGTLYRVNAFSQLGAYGAFGPNYGSFLISDGPQVFTIADANDSQFFTTITVDPPAPCSDVDCSISAVAQNIQCQNAGTPTDPSDDTFTFDLLVTGTNTVSNEWVAAVFFQPVFGEFGVPITVGPYLIGNGSFGIPINDVDDGTCFTNVEVTYPSTCSGGPGDLIDLELSLDQSTADPAQWASYEITATLANEGDTPATGVEVSFAKPAGVVYTGGNEWDASQGSFNPFGSEKWDVGSIAPGASATLTVSYFLLASEAPTAWAEVSAANEPDADSTPGNGISPAVNEDDEASTDGGGGGPNCNIGFTGIMSVCDDNGTPSDPSDDEWYASINPSGTGLGNSFSITGDISASGLTYGQVHLFGPYPIQPFFERNFIISDDDTPGCTAQFILEPTATCSNGPGGDADLTISGLNISNSPVEAGEILNYDFDLANIGTADVPGSFNVKGYISTDAVLSGDDIQDGTVPTGNYAAGFSQQNISGASTIPGSLAPGQYFLIVKVDADDQISESNENNNVVSAPFTVDDGGPTGGDIDLSLGMVASPMNPPIYTNTEVTVEITNAGPQTATGVVVEFPRPSGTVYTGGNEWDATQGSFNPFGNEKWTVGSLAPGETASLTVSYFLLSANALTPFAQVDAANETDGDSSPANGTCCTPSEDDDGVLTLNSFGGSGSTLLTLPEMKGREIVLVNIYPTPTYFGEVNLKIASQDEREEFLEIYDAFGRVAHRQVIQLRAGYNDIQLDIADFRSGIYQIMIRGHNLRAMPRSIVVEKW